jgi:hypothetical protein
MKKIVVALLLVLMAASSSYAENVLEYKRVVLCLKHRTVLVNRFTGQVKYVMDFNNRKKWVLLTKQQQRHYQSAYEHQIKVKMVCH